MSRFWPVAEATRVARGGTGWRGRLVRRRDCAYREVREREGGGDRPIEAWKHRIRVITGSPAHAWHFLSGTGVTCPVSATSNAYAST